MEDAQTAALWAAYKDIIDVAGTQRIGYELPTVRTGGDLLSLRFGDLVWLCRVLELAFEAYTEDKPGSFEYSYTDALKNVVR